MKRTLPRALTVGIVALVALATVSACSSNAAAPSASGSAGDAKLTHIVVGMQPITPFSNVPLGVEKGIFEKHGLDVETKVISEATTIPPAVLAGQLQFAAWSYASFTSLANSNLPLITVGPGDTAGTDLKTDYTQLLVMPDSGITKVADLKGKKIATNSLNSLSEIQTKVALANAGVDPDSVTYVPIPYASQGAALQGGQVDAAQVAEPFLTQYEHSLGAKSLAALDVAIMPNLPVSTWFTSQQYAAQNPKVVEEFQQALRESSLYAQTHPKDVRAFIPKFTGVDKATADAMILPTWVTKVDFSKIQSVADTMYKYGAVPKKIDMSKYIKAFPTN